MTLASDISTTSTSLSDIKNAIIAKGVTPSGNITTYAAAIGNINTDGIGLKREVKNGVYQMPTENFTFSLPSDATEVGSYALAYSFYGDSYLIGADLSSLTTVGSNGLYNAFSLSGISGSIDLSSLTTVGINGLYFAFYNTRITSIDLSSLTTVGSSGLRNIASACLQLIGSIDLSSLTTVGSNGLNGAFNNSRITSIDLSSLTTVEDNGLQLFVANNPNLTDIDLSSLTTVGIYGLNSAFMNDTSLSVLRLQSLTTINASQALTQMLYGCMAITDVYFNALTTTSFGSNTNQFNNMMSNTGSNTTHTLHFPSNMESTISGLTGYPLFGGTSGYVVLAFDLPATS